MKTQTKKITRRQLFAGNSGNINIVSLLVSAKPDLLNDVRSEIKNAEVQHVDKKGKIIVTLETKTEQEIVSAIDDIQDINGVVSVALVFHHIEKEEAA